MIPVQPGIPADAPRLARQLIFLLRPDADAREPLRALAARPVDEGAIFGLGASLVRALGATVEGLRTFPHHAGPGFEVPSTPAALWCWLRGTDRGELLHAGRAVTALLAPAFDLHEVVEPFQYADSRDLTGYEDGTENPTGDRALEVGLVQGRGPGLDGSSFVAVQRWLHDLDRFEAMPQAERDAAIGRRRSDNEEMDDAPPSAHVKRTAQESFEPEAFLLRRSMPWSSGGEAGLVFVAFGRSFDAFEAQLRRMVGEEDGIADALFRFTRPLTGAYFWCPPCREGRLDLRAIGL